MIAPLAKSIDWSFIQTLAGLSPPGGQKREGVKISQFFELKIRKRATEEGEKSFGF